MYFSVSDTGILFGASKAHIQFEFGFTSTTSFPTTFHQKILSLGYNFHHQVILISHHSKYSLSFIHKKLILKDIEGIFNLPVQKV